MTRFFSLVLTLAILASSNDVGVHAGKDKQKNKNVAANSDDAKDPPGYVRAGSYPVSTTPAVNTGTGTGTGTGSTGGTSSTSSTSSTSFTTPAATTPATTGTAPDTGYLTEDDLESITANGANGCYVELTDGRNFMLPNGAPLGGLVGVDECRSPTNRCFCNTNFGDASGIYCPVCVFEDAAPMLVRGWGKQCASAGKTVTYRTSATGASEGVAMKQCTCNADPTTGVATATCQPFSSNHIVLRGRHLIEQELQEE